MWEDYSKKLKYYLSNIPDGSYEMFYSEILYRIEQFIIHKDERVLDGIDQILSGPPTAEGFNNLLSMFITDTAVLARMTDNTKLVDAHNTTTSAFDTIRDRITKVRSRLLELTSLKSQRRRYVGCDTFMDISKVDPTTISNHTCSVDTQHGLVTLNKIKADELSGYVQSIDVGFPKEAQRRVGVDDYIKQADSNSSNYSGIDIFYEGQYYAPIGQAFPEGGFWRFKIDTTKSIPFESGSVLYKGAVVDLGKVPDTYAIYEGQLVFKINIEGQDYIFGIDASKQNDITFIKNSDQLTARELLLKESGIAGHEGFVALDEEATEEDLQESRKFMLDGDPLTYWQCEVNKLWESVKNDKESRIDLIPIFDWNTQSWFYNTITTTTDAFYDLKVSLTFNFDQRRAINWITLSPYNFPKLYDENTPIHITNIEYSELGTEWKQIPGFNYLILTQNVNQVLDEYTQGLLMADNKYAFKGKGVWTFETVNALKIRITIAQPYPYQVFYQNYKLQLASQSMLSNNDTIQSTARTELITLPYLNTVAVTEGSLDMTSLAVETEGVSSTTSSSNSRTSGGGLLGFLFGTKTSFSSNTSSFSDTGQYIVNKWLQTNPSPVGRYAIGIREVGFSSYTFSNNSEMISTTYQVPEEIGELELEVDDYIPESFDNATRWIKYYLTIDGTTWHEISPINREYNGIPTRLKVGNTTPLSYEKVIPDNNSKSVQLRVVLSRPSDQNNESPKLLGYKIYSYPKV